jgi:signal transduction histidine kinase
VRTVGDAADLRRTSRRLGLQTGLLVVGCVLVVGSLLFGIYERAASSATDQQLVDATARIDRPAEAPPGIRVVIVTPHGTLASPGLGGALPDRAALAAVARDGRTRQSDVDSAGHAYTIRTARVGDRVVQAILDGQQAEEERERILTALLIASGVGVLLAGLVAAWLAHRAVRPMADTITMQRRFVADASHELRTPLTLLSTRVQLLARRVRQRGDAPPDVVEDLDGVIADTRTLTEILDDLLIAADTRTSAAKEPCDLAALVRECASATAAAAERAGIELSVDSAAPTLVLGASASLRRAVTALLDNALDHARSRVDVTVARHGGSVRLDVADDGPGISDYLAPRVFDRFASSRPEQDPDGRRHYGLGLALVADVAAAHGGRVSAGSRADGPVGAVLSLELPAHRGRGL